LSLPTLENRKLQQELEKAKFKLGALIVEYGLAIEVDRNLIW
jgi:hypothetical protein